MNTTPHDGGPAFSATRIESVGRDSANPVMMPVEYCGMSLRDLFAGMALQGLCMNPPTETEALTDCASLAYNIADAMILARKERP